MDMYKTTYTLAEAANLLHCHKETLRRAILEGSLQAARLGKGYRISRAELQKFWINMGGGELFEPESLGRAEQTGESAEQEKAVKHEQKPKGQHQLALPIT